LKGIDFIGDVHGEHEHLITLLKKLSYKPTGDTWSHPAGRKVCFLGDYVDRGPQIREVLVTVRAMVESNDAFAIMGNHEFNLISWHTPLIDGSPERCRPESKRYQLVESLKQLGEGDNKWIDWLRTLPPTLELPGDRAVHACWSPEDVDKLAAAWFRAGNYWTPELIRSASKGQPLFDVVERVMKGPEIPLPEGTTMELGDGDIRHSARIQWWTPADISAPMGGQVIPHLKTDSPTLTVAQSMTWPPDITQEHPLVFCGHYWLKGDAPSPRTDKVICLDYSVAKKGFLCAYRFDGEKIALTDKMVGSR
jgi:hypothetical protein